MHGYDGWHMGGMWSWWILIAAVMVVVAVVWFSLSMARRRRGGSTESPEQALKRRYAKGELDREAYERMLADLRA